MKTAHANGKWNKNTKRINYTRKKALKKSADVVVRSVAVDWVTACSVRCTNCCCCCFSLCFVVARFVVVLFRFSGCIKRQIVSWDQHTHAHMHTHARTHTESALISRRSARARSHRMQPEQTQRQRQRQRHLARFYLTIQKWMKPRRCVAAAASVGVCPAAAAATAAALLCYAVRGSGPMRRE